MFEENSDDNTKWYRRFAIVVLTAGQLAIEQEVNQAFQLHVGTHHEIGGDRKLRPQDQWRHFYDKYLDYCRTDHYEENDVVAWFEL